ncbi:MAG: tail fiber domain-containing protein [Bacteroidales bacterium]|jgi:hypothetical protein|nr:tail fiber domain-containing protein [Bacteroidales bacterium]
MKTKPSFLYLVSFFFCLSLCPAPLALSQTPQGFYYQAIARNASGVPLGNQFLQVRITIQSDSLGGTLFWQELHSSVTTTPQGVINLVIGKGARESASTLAKFSDIDWSVSPKFLKTEINFNGWKTLGASRIWSVPYAQVAGDLAGSVKKLAVEGEATGPAEALFEVKNKDGQTVFAVYNEGVRIYVSNGDKAVKGGFAVGGFGTDKAESTKYLFVGKDSVRIYLDTNPLTKKIKGGFAVGGYDLTKGTVQNYLDVSSDSVRIYIDSDPSTKKIKGGFAVGGYDMTKAISEEYLRVTRDSSRIYVNNNPAKGIKGGFAVGGFDISKGTVTPFTQLTPENYLIGQDAGKSITTGKYNSFLGYQAGAGNTAGGSNSLMGYQAGFSNTTGSGNLLLGYQAGYSNTTGSYNTFLGYLAGNQNSSGLGNSFIGSYTGHLNQNGSNNTFIGFNAGGGNISGSHNIFIGTESGISNTMGSYNCFVGYHTGYSNTVGMFNVFMGFESGNDNNGSNNTFLGYMAGRSNTSGGNNLFIGREAGWGNINGTNNTYLGPYAGKEIANGHYNVYIGTFAGQKNADRTANVFLGFNSGTFSNSGASVAIGFYAGHSMSGDMNTCLGYAAGQNANGHFNVIIGSQAGLELSGINNVIIGQQAGMKAKANNIIIGNYAAKNQFADARLFIDNFDRDSSQTFIWGNLPSRILTFNANVGIGTCTPGYKFQVGQAGDGTEARANAWNLLSDMRYKTDIEYITAPLEKISGISGFYFYWNTGSDKTRQFGLSAQDVEKVLPEVVSTGEDGYKSVDYGKIVPLLVEGMKAQQKQIDELKALVEKLMQE